MVIFPKLQSDGKALKAMVSRQKDKESVQTRVYKYGLVLKTALPQEAISELYRANKLWNKLVELHNQNWQEFEAQRCAVDEDYANISKEAKLVSEQIDAAYDTRRLLRVETGNTEGNDPKTKVIDKKIKELKEQRSALWGNLKKRRNKIDNLIDKQALNQKRKDAFKHAVQVKQSGLSSQTADEVRRDFDNARDRIINKPSSGRLRFHRFDGTGYWQYRFRSSNANVDGVSFVELFRGNKDTGRAFELLSMDVTRKKPRLHLRAKLSGGVIKASKLFHEFDLIYHRPIPDNGQIQNGKILRTRSGDKFRYDLVLTVKFPKPENRVFACDNALGVDIGFREDKGKLLVATIGLLDGSHYHYIFVPKKFQQAIEHIDNLKKELDKSAGTLGKKLKSHLRSFKDFTPLEQSQIEQLEAEERAEYVFKMMCRSVARMPNNVTFSFEKAYKLARALKHHHDMISSEASDAITLWWRGHSRRYRELHNLRAKQIRNRNDFYRNEAAKLIRYDLPIAVEDNFSASIAQVRDKDSDLKKTARKNRFLCAPSLLISAIKNAFERENLAFVKVNPKNTSKTCFDCGHINKKLGSEKEWRCPNCGISHDRDENATRNIAKKGIEALKKAGKCL